MNGLKHAHHWSRCVQLVCLGFLSAFFLAQNCCAEPNAKYLPTATDLLLMVNKWPEPPVSVTGAEVKEDVDLLIYALKNGYGGRKYVPAKIFNDALSDLGLISGSMSTKELNNRVDEILWTIPDNHLSARLRGRSCNARESADRQSDAGSNAIDKDRKVWQVRLDQRAGVSVLYISILSFPSGQDPLWNGLIDQVEKLKKQSQMLVLDLRGNGGGDDSMGVRLANLCYGNRITKPIYKQITLQTPEALAIYSNAFRSQQLNYRARHNESPPAYLEKRLEVVMQDFKLAQEHKLPDESVELDDKRTEFDPQKGYDKPIFILIDGACGSSGEATVDAFEFHPQVLRVGCNTSGTIQFGNAGMILLPHSGIRVTIPTKYKEYFDKRAVEKIGIKPDIPTAAGQDAYDLAVQSFKDNPSHDNRVLREKLKAADASTH